MPKHADDEPVMFHYGASRNASFTSQPKGEDSGYTWGEWREMNSAEKDAAREDFIYQTLGVGVWEDDDE